MNLLLNNFSKYYFNFFLINNWVINIGDIVYIKYFFFFKKKRKIFKFYGLCFNKKKNFYMKVKTMFHDENLVFSFSLYNPYLIEVKKILFYNTYRIKRQYFKKQFWFNNFSFLSTQFFFGGYNFFFDDYLIVFLLRSICSQYKFNKFVFLFKTRYKFR